MSSCLDLQLRGKHFLILFAKFTTPTEKRPEEAPTIPTVKIPKWVLYVDGFSNEEGSAADLILVSLEGHQMDCALRFKFKASNNEAKDEALIAGLNLAKEMKVESLEVYSDS